MIGLRGENRIDRYHPMCGKSNAVVTFRGAEVSVMDVVATSLGRDAPRCGPVCGDAAEAGRNFGNCLLVARDVSTALAGIN